MNNQIPEEYRLTVLKLSKDILQMFDDSELDIPTCMGVLTSLLVSGAMAVGMPQDTLLSTIKKMYELKNGPEKSIVIQ